MSLGSLRRLKAILIAPLRSYSDAAKKRPFVVGTATTVLKTSAADAFAQVVVEQKDARDIDWKRNALFAAFGFTYLGCLQYWLYNKAFVQLAPSITRAVGASLTPAVLVFLDQAIHHPTTYFPTFYVMKGAMENHALTAKVVRDSLAKYRSEMWDNLKACWMVWVPSQLVNFTLVPLHLRIPFVAAVSFGWTVILSIMRGQLHMPQVHMPQVHMPQVHMPKGVSSLLHTHTVVHASELSPGSAPTSCIQASASSASLGSSDDCGCAIAAPPPELGGCSTPVVACSSMATD